MAHESTNFRLTRIAKEIGTKYGFREVTAEIGSFDTFKVKWSRTYMQVNFVFSKKFVRVPDNVFRDILTSLFVSFKGKNRPYSPETMAWIEKKKKASKSPKESHPVGL